MRSIGLLLRDSYFGWLFVVARPGLALRFKALYRRNAYIDISQITNWRMDSPTVEVRNYTLY